MIRSNISFIVSKLIKNDKYELTKNMWRKNSVIFRKCTLHIVSNHGNFQKVNMAQHLSICKHTYELANNMWRKNSVTFRKCTLHIVSNHGNFQKVDMAQNLPTFLFARIKAEKDGLKENFFHF